MTHRAAARSAESKKEAYDWVADESATLFQQAVTFDRSQKLVFH
jgi:hypothetical protein